MHTHRARLTGSGRPRRDRAQGGFSLIEILIAMTVTLIGLAGLMSLYTTAVTANARSTSTINASVVAQQTMEELRSMPVLAPSTGYDGPTLENTIGVPVTDFLLAPITAQNGTEYQRRVSVVQLPSPVNNLYRITVGIRWADEGANVDTTTDNRLIHDLVLETIRTRQDLL